MCAFSMLASTFKQTGVKGGGGTESHWLIWQKTAQIQSISFSTELNRVKQADVQIKSLKYWNLN